MYRTTQRFGPLSHHAIQRTITSPNGDIMDQAISYRRPIADGIMSSICSAFTLGRINLAEQRDIQHRNGILHLASCLHAYTENHLFSGMKLLYTTEYEHHAEPKNHGYCIIQDGPEIALHYFEQGLYGEPYIPSNGEQLLKIENEDIFIRFKTKLAKILENTTGHRNPPVQSYEMAYRINDWIWHMQSSRGVLPFINTYNYTGVVKARSEQKKKQMLAALERMEKEFMMGTDILLLTDECPITFLSVEDLLKSQNPICALGRQHNHPKVFSLVDFESLKRWVNIKPTNPITGELLQLDNIKVLDSM